MTITATVNGRWKMSEMVVPVGATRDGCGAGAGRAGGGPRPAPSVEPSLVEAPLHDRVKAAVPTILERTGFPGGEVTVSLDCTVSFEGLGLIGVPGTVGMDASSTVPLDPYRSFE